MNDCVKLLPCPFCGMQPERIDVLAPDMQTVNYFYHQHPKNDCLLANLYVGDGEPLDINDPDQWNSRVAGLVAKDQS